jgi:hypothetical protein
MNDIYCYNIKLTSWSRNIKIYRVDLSTELKMAQMFHKPLLLLQNPNIHLRHKKKKLDPIFNQLNTFHALNT